VATLGYTNAKVRENYSRRFRIRFPNEELPAARPMQTTALYDKMVAQGAVMGDSWGLETPLWFAAERASSRRDIVSFRRSNDFPYVKAECLRSGEASASPRSPTREVHDHRQRRRGVPVAADDEPHAEGRPHRADPMLNERGKLIGDFTIAKADDERFFMWGSSQAQIYSHALVRAASACGRLGRDAPRSAWSWSACRLPDRARGSSSKLTDEDVSAERLRFLDFRETHLASVPVMLNRVTYTGDLGYEIWVKPEYQRRLYEKIMEAGEEFGIVTFGMRALLSLRLEKKLADLVSRAPVRCTGRSRRTPAASSI